MPFSLSSGRKLLSFRIQRKEEKKRDEGAGRYKLVCLISFLSPGRLFSRYWREEFIVLYEDSSVAWFKDKNRTEPEVK